MRETRLADAAFTILDVETTGTDPRRDAVVEVALTIVRDGREVRSFSSLVDPKRPIPARASSVHHLRDDDVAGEPTLAELAPILEQLCRGTVLVAHNAAFDLGFLPMFADAPALCTLRLARHCFPELDGHANQVLRYALDVRPPRGAGQLVAHRALDDVRVTAAVLEVLVRRYRELGHPDEVGALLDFATAPIPLLALPFGEHRGQPLAKVPTSYLRWVQGRGETFDADIQHAVAQELAQRRTVSSPPAC
jgi:DNA polymerase III epsilon subunit family exonuclease